MTKPNSVQFHQRVRAGLPVTSSSLSVSVSSRPEDLPDLQQEGGASLPLQLLSVRLGRAWAHGSSVPDFQGAHTWWSSFSLHFASRKRQGECTLITEKRIWNISLVDEEVRIFLGSDSIAHQYRLRRNSELHVLLQPLWCSCFRSLCSFVYVGVSESFNKYFHFLARKEPRFVLSGGNEKGRRMAFTPAISIYLNCSM